MMKRFNWYGIKQLYEWRSRQRSKTTVIEERIVVVAAKDWDSAFRKVTDEGRRYCENDPTANFRIFPLSTKLSGYLMDPLDLDPSEVVEVYSLLHRNVPVDKKREFVKYHLKTTDW